MDPELAARLDAQEKKLDAIFVSVEKTRKYFQWTLIATIITFVLPLIGIVLVLPWFVKTMLSAYSI
jgi:hypothetical protein